MAAPATAPLLMNSLLFNEFSDMILS